MNNIAHCIKKQLATQACFIPLPNTGAITSAWFASITHWSESDCLELLSYYLEQERINRKGWNNNMSLVTQEGKTEDVTWSLIYWKFETFKMGVPVIIPFSLQEDERGILRATTTLQKIKDKAIFCSLELRAVATGERRQLMVEAFCTRIRNGFSWNYTRNTKKNKIRRYRLVVLLNAPNLELTSDFDVHHLNGIQELLKDNKTLAATDDRSFNLEVRHKTEHHEIHNSLGDNQFRNYRKPKQLSLDIQQPSEYLNISELEIVEKSDRAWISRAITKREIDLENKDCLNTAA